MARDLPDGHHIPAHRHRRAQLIYGTSGAITVTTDHGVWVVPATRAAWIPAGLTHAMTCAGAVAMRTSTSTPRRPWNCPGPHRRVGLPLLRELIDEATRLPVEYDRQGREGRSWNSSCCTSPRTPSRRCTSRPRGRPPRRGLRRDPAAPGERWTTARAAAHAHMSPRSLHRRFTAATGMSLAHWVQQARLVHAVTLLAGARR
ncbi:helix-turn-helix domain-containing protein [Streptomyces sp. M19]